MKKLMLLLVLLPFLALGCASSGGKCSMHDGMGSKCATCCKGDCANCCKSGCDNCKDCGNCCSK